MKTGEEESATLVAEYAQRHRIKPGMTGWAAIHGSRGPLRLGRGRAPPRRPRRPLHRAPVVLARRVDHRDDRAERARRPRGGAVTRTVPARSATSAVADQSSPDRPSSRTTRGAGWIAARRGASSPCSASCSRTDALSQSAREDLSAISTALASAVAAVGDVPGGPARHGPVASGVVALRGDHRAVVDRQRRQHRRRRARPTASSSRRWPTCSGCRRCRSPSSACSTSPAASTWRGRSLARPRRRPAGDVADVHHVGAAARRRLRAQPTSAAWAAGPAARLLALRHAGVRDGRQRAAALAAAAPQARSCWSARASPSTRSPTPSFLDPQPATTGSSSARPSTSAGSSACC